MSRIGNRILKIEDGVNVTLENGKLIVKGPKGELNLDIDKEVKVEITDEGIKTTSNNSALHGTYNALIKNMLIGVKDGYTKELEIVGVGYRFNLAGNKLTVNAGYSKPVEVIVPSDIHAETPSNTELKLSSVDKIKLGEFAANVRKIREPEPYKGKGIRYKDEHIRRKEGKKVA